MKRKFRALVFALVFVSCGSPTDTDPLPEWLVALIEELESQPVANPPAYIARLEYAAGVYYYLPPRCCDIPSALFDSEGAFVFAPDGGITGDGDGRCPALGERLSEEIVWRDARGVT